MQMVKPSLRLLDLVSAVGEGAFMKKRKNEHHKNWRQALGNSRAYFLTIAATFAISGCESPESKTIIESDDGSLTWALDEYKALPKESEKRRKQFLSLAFKNIDYSSVEKVFKQDFDGGQYISLSGWGACGTLKLTGKSPGTYGYSESSSSEGNLVLIYYWRNPISCENSNDTSKPDITKTYRY